MNKLKLGMATAWLAACLLWILVPSPLHVEKAIVHAQGSNYCDQFSSISVAAAATQTIASAIPGTTVYVCGFLISGDTIATTGQFKSGTTNIGGAMRMCDECADSFGDGSAVIFQAPQSGNLTITAAAGAITGFVRFGQN